MMESLGSYPILSIIIKIIHVKYDGSQYGNYNIRNNA